MSRAEVVPISSGSEDEDEDRTVQPPTPEEEDIIKDLVYHVSEWFDCQRRLNNTSFFFSVWEMVWTVTRLSRVWWRDRFTRLKTSSLGTPTWFVTTSSPVSRNSNLWACHWTKLLASQAVCRLRSCGFVSAKYGPLRAWNDVNHFGNCTCTPIRFKRFRVWITFITLTHCGSTITLSGRSMELSHLSRSKISTWPPIKSPKSEIPWSAIETWKAWIYQETKSPRSRTWPVLLNSKI